MQPRTLESYHAEMVKSFLTLSHVLRSYGRGLVLEFIPSLLRAQGKLTLITKGYAATQSLSLLKRIPRLLSGGRQSQFNAFHGPNGSS